MKKILIPQCNEVLNKFLHQYQQNMSAEAFEHLRLAAHQASRQPRYTADFLSLTAVFNKTVRPEFNSAAQKLCRKIDKISVWLESEHQRKAVWLSRLDGDGRPRRLVSNNLDYLYHTAQKQLERHEVMNPPKRTKGVLQASAETLQNWDLSKLPPPDEFYKKMTIGLPQGTDLLLDIDKNGQPSYLEYQYQKRKQQGFSFTRWLHLDSATHGIAMVEPKMQKHGIAKIVNHHLFDFYRERGITKVTLDAEAIGAYAWARLGFVPKADAWNNMRPKIEQRLDFITAHPPPEGALETAQINALRQALQGDNPKNYWFIVDQETACHGITLGKILTLPLDRLPKEFSAKIVVDPKELRDIYWSGILDMQDPDCTARYTAYLQVDKPPTPVAKMQPVKRMKASP